MSALEALSWVPTGVLVVGLVALIRGDKTRGYGMYACGYWAAYVIDVARGTMPWLDGLWAVLFTWLWWRNRRKGGWRRAARELGAKSKARVEAMVEQMTPSPIPSPAGAV